MELKNCTSLTLGPRADSVSISVFDRDHDSVKTHMFVWTIQSAPITRWTLRPHRVIPVRYVKDMLLVLDHVVGVFMFRSARATQQLGVTNLFRFLAPARKTL